MPEGRFIAYYRVAPPGWVSVDFLAGEGCVVGRTLQQSIYMIYRGGRGSFSEYDVHLNYIPNRARPNRLTICDRSRGTIDDQRQSQPNV